MSLFIPNDFERAVIKQGLGLADMVNHNHARLNRYQIPLDKQLRIMGLYSRSELWCYKTGRCFHRHHLIDFEDRHCYLIYLWRQLADLSCQNQREGGLTFKLPEVFGIPVFDYLASGRLIHILHALYYLKRYRSS